MKQEELIEILKQAGRLRTTMRHCWLDTEEGQCRRESVAEHSWRLALMAMLISGEPEFKETDMNKVIRMCLIHDLGESFTGDIPVFLKSEEDAGSEIDVYRKWICQFPEPQRSEWLDLIDEMEALRTREAKTYKALDKLEALIAHNESDLSTWLPLEYELQLTYGQDNMKFSPYFTELRKQIDEWTEEKISEKDRSGDPC